MLIEEQDKGFPELEEGQWRCARCTQTKRFSDSKWATDEWDGICSSCLRAVENG